MYRWRRRRCKRHKFACDTKTQAYWIPYAAEVHPAVNSYPEVWCSESISKILDLSIDATLRVTCRQLVICIILRRPMQCAGWFDSEMELGLIGPESEIMPFATLTPLKPGLNRYVEFIDFWTWLL